MTTPHPLTGVIPLAGDPARDLLRRVLDRARQLAPRGVIAFDLDSTLLNNRPRQSRILREYGEHHKEPLLSQSKAEHWDSGWDECLAMVNAGLTRDQAQSHREPFKQFWGERFFTSEYCRLDLPIVGAPLYLRALAETGTLIVYLTGRHEQMRPGTLESFTAAGFPLPNETSIRLWMKQSLEDLDDAFKDRSMRNLLELGPLVAAFDNEPTHINIYRKAFPDAVSVHLATDCSLRRVKVGEGIASISDFSAWR